MDKSICTLQGSCNNHTLQQQFDDYWNAAPDKCSLITDTKAMINLIGQNPAWKQADVSFIAAKKDHFIYFLELKRWLKSQI